MDFSQPRETLKNALLAQIEEFRSQLTHLRFHSQTEYEQAGATDLFLADAVLSGEMLHYSPGTAFRRQEGDPGIRPTPAQKREIVNKLRAIKDGIKDDEGRRSAEEFIEVFDEDGFIYAPADHPQFSMSAVWRHDGKRRALISLYFLYKLPDEMLGHIMVHEGVHLRNSMFAIETRKLEEHIYQTLVAKESGRLNLSDQDLLTLILREIILELESEWRAYYREAQSRQNSALDLGLSVPDYLNRMRRANDEKLDGIIDWLVNDYNTIWHHSNSSERNLKAKVLWIFFHSDWSLYGNTVKDIVQRQLLLLANRLGGEHIVRNNQEAGTLDIQDYHALLDWIESNARRLKIYDDYQFPPVQSAMRAPVQFAGVSVFANIEDALRTSRELSPLEIYQALQDGIDWEEVERQATLRLGVPYVSPQITEETKMGQDLVYGLTLNNEELIQIYQERNVRAGQKSLHIGNGVLILPIIDALLGADVTVIEPFPGFRERFEAVRAQVQNLIALSKEKISVESQSLFDPALQQKLANASFDHITALEVLVSGERIDYYKGQRRPIPLQDGLGGVDKNHEAAQIIARLKNPSGGSIYISFAGAEPALEISEDNVMTATLQEQGLLSASVRRSKVPTPGMSRAGKQYAIFNKNRNILESQGLTWRNVPDYGPSQYGLIYQFASSEMRVPNSLQPTLEAMFVKRQDIFIYAPEALQRASTIYRLLYNYSGLSNFNFDRRVKIGLPKTPAKHSEGSLILVLAKLPPKQLTALTDSHPQFRIVDFSDNIPINGEVLYQALRVEEQIPALSPPAAAVSPKGSATSKTSKKPVTPRSDQGALERDRKIAEAILNIFKLDRMEALTPDDLQPRLGAAVLVDASGNPLVNPIVKIREVLAKLHQIGALSRKPRRSGMTKPYEYRLNTAKSEMRGTVNQIETTLKAMFSARQNIFIYDSVTGSERGQRLYDLIFIRSGVSNFIFISRVQYGLPPEKPAKNSNGGLIFVLKKLKPQELKDLTDAHPGFQIVNFSSGSIDVTSLSRALGIVEQTVTPSPSAAASSTGGKYLPARRKTPQLPTAERMEKIVEFLKSKENQPQTVGEIAKNFFSVTIGNADNAQQGIIRKFMQAYPKIFKQRTVKRLIAFRVVPAKYTQLQGDDWKEILAGWLAGRAQSSTDLSEAQKRDMQIAEAMFSVLKSRQNLSVTDIQPSISAKLFGDLNDPGKKIRSLATALSKAGILQQGNEKARGNKGGTPLSVYSLGKSWKRLWGEKKEEIVAELNRRSEMRVDDGGISRRHYKDRLADRRKFADNGAPTQPLSFYDVRKAANLQKVNRFAAHQAELEALYDEADLGSLKVRGDFSIPTPRAISKGYSTITPDLVRKYVSALGHNLVPGSYEAAELRKRIVQIFGGIKPREKRNARQFGNMLWKRSNNLNVVLDLIRRELEYDPDRFKVRNLELKKIKTVIAIARKEGRIPKRSFDRAAASLKKAVEDDGRLSWILVSSVLQNAIRQEVNGTRTKKRQAVDSAMAWKVLEHQAKFKRYIYILYQDGGIRQRAGTIRHVHMYRNKLIVSWSNFSKTSFRNDSPIFDVLDEKGYSLTANHRSLRIRSSRHPAASEMRANVVIHRLTRYLNQAPRVSEVVQEPIVVLAGDVDRTIRRMTLPVFETRLRQIQARAEHQKVRIYLRNLARIAEAVLKDFQGDVGIAFNLEGSEAQMLQMALSELREIGNSRIHLLVPSGPLSEIHVPGMMTETIGRSIENVTRNRFPLLQEGIATLTDEGRDLENERFYGVDSRGSEALSGLNSTNRKVVDYATRSIISIILGVVDPRATLVRNPQMDEDALLRLNRALFGVDTFNEATNRAIQKIGWNRMTVDVGILFDLLTQYRANSEVRTAA
ncbi:MAG: hypothetical protein HYZ84_03050 [Candidatus Omnitrophica bacterium]|nr:hypothetical protein [Candidatus Omnitrophota bacterium]